MEKINDGRWEECIRQLEKAELVAITVEVYDANTDEIITHGPKTWARGTTTEAVDYLIGRQPYAERIVVEIFADSVSAPIPFKFP